MEKSNHSSTVYQTEQDNCSQCCTTARAAEPRLQTCVPRRGVGLEGPTDDTRGSSAELGVRVKTHRLGNMSSCCSRNPAYLTRTPLTHLPGRPPCDLAHRGPGCMGTLPGKPPPLSLASFLNLFATDLLLAPGSEQERGYMFTCFTCLRSFGVGRHGPLVAFRQELHSCGEAGAVKQRAGARRVRAATHLGAAC